MKAGQRISAALLAGAAVRARSVEEFIAVTGGFLCATPLKVERVFLSLQTLHPAFRARTYLWRNETGPVSVIEWPHGLKNRPGYYDSPDFHVHRSRTEFRVGNLQEISDRPCDLYGKLKAEGYTDYLMVPLIFRDGSVNTLSIATKLPAGFPARELHLIRDVKDILTVIIEGYAALETVSSVLQTYLGRSASREVLRGGIQAGHAELVRAAILFADLHDFTKQSGRLGPVQTVRLLNDYFDCLVDPIEEHGGYVLKFIGDAILAFFPIEASETPEPAPVQAVIAVRRRLADLNRARQAQGEPVLRHRLCLHFGDVLYGNVGSSERLDFTIIGEGVNVAQRVVEAMNSRKVDYLFTRQFVDQFGDHGLVYVGSERVRGSLEPVEVFTLSSEGSEKDDWPARGKTDSASVV